MLVPGYDSSDDGASSSSSDGESDQQAFNRDYGEEPEAPGSTALPNVLAAFGQVEGPPEFLEPDATRQRKVCSAHLKRKREADGAAAAAAAATVDPAAVLARLAPRLKGTATPACADPADAGAAVLSAPATRTQGRAAPQAAEEADEGARPHQGPSTDGLVAMLGGGDRGEGKKGDRGKPTKAMEVQDFLSRGGGANLPRRKGERKDREKSKRALGQSSHHVWKSEAEMVLRQQFDS